MSAADQNAHYRSARKLARQGKLLPAIEAFEKALAQHPDDPTILFELARVAKRAGMFDVAAELFKNVLRQRPESWETWNNLGTALTGSGKYDEAIDALSRATELGGRSGQMLGNLAQANERAGYTAEALKLYDEVLTAAPRDLNALSGVADMLLARCQYGACLPYFERALKLAKKASDREQLRYNRAMALLGLGRLAAGWDAYEARLHPQIRQVVYGHRFKPYKGAELAGRAILVTAEQGLGDQIEFASQLPKLQAAGARVHVAVEPRLVPLFERSFPDAVIHSYRQERAGHIKKLNMVWRDGEPTVDWALPIASLPRYFGRDVDAIRGDTPYLQADPAARRRWRQRLDALAPGRPKVGICWRSGKLTGERWRHYQSLMEWREVLREDGIALVNLQYDGGLDEIAAAEGELGIKIHHFDDLDQTVNLDETAALISEVDFIVSAATAVSQLGGALGVPSVKTSNTFFMFGVRPILMQPVVWPVWQPDTVVACLAELRAFKEKYHAPGISPGGGPCLVQ